jgi:hybrid cluster-associated redox disulfide protein
MITKDMKIGEICRLYPQAAPVLKRFGLDCLECQIAELEELEHGAGVHKVDMEKLLEELNRVVGD